MLERFPVFARKVYPQAIFKIKSDKDVLYLTFDDGPDPEASPDVLSILKSYNAKATFFCVGENVKNYKKIYDDIIQAGHSVGNHTFNHLQGWKTNNPEYINNIDKASEYINSNLFRPPYGQLKISQYKILKESFKIVMWDVLSMDFDIKTSKENCVNNVIKLAKPGSVVVFHDSKKMIDKVIYALPQVLEYFSKKNYLFEAIRVED